MSGKLCCNGRHLQGQHPRALWCINSILQDMEHVLCYERWEWTRDENTDPTEYKGISTSGTKEKHKLMEVFNTAQMLLKS